MTKSNGTRLNGWAKAIAVIVALLINIGGLSFWAGRVTARLEAVEKGQTGLEEQVDGIEKNLVTRINRVEDRVNAYHGGK
ncbi:MAG: hypothetical protein IH969_09085 [Candidatus Krumholzibacteriota bacterium]|nr:hypothetical protein [Candidatus Krumholzibacteriota bacterium]